MADRRGDQGSGVGPADHRSRLSQRGRRRRHSRREPDADRRPEHRQRALPRHLADRPGPSRGLRLQHPQPARDGQSGRRERHARSRRPEDDRRRPHHRPQVDRARRAGADANRARTTITPACWSSRCSCSRSTRRRRSISAYRDVTAAQQDQQRAVNDADTYANSVVPEAKGAASRILAEAKPTSSRRSSTRKGQTARYSQIYAQYKNAPGVTRERMYLETMERVLGGDEQDDPRRARRQRAGALSGARPVDRKSRRERRNEEPVQRPGDPDRRRRRRSSSPATRCSPSIRPSRRWCCASASRSATSSARRACTSRCPFIDSVVYIDKRILALDNRAPGGAGRREPAARSRRLRALPHRRPAACSITRCSTSRAPTRSSAAC